MQLWWCMRHPLRGPPFCHLLWEEFRRNCHKSPGWLWCFQGWACWCPCWSVERRGMEWTEVGEQGGGQQRGHQRELTSRESWWCAPGWPHLLSELLCDKMYERVQPRGGGLLCRSFWGGLAQSAGVRPSSLGPVQSWPCGLRPTSGQKMSCPCKDSCGGPGVEVLAAGKQSRGVAYDGSLALKVSPL